MSAGASQPHAARRDAGSTAARVGLLSPLKPVVDALGEGRLVAIASASAVQSECMFCIAADSATAEAINWMIVNGGGLICVALTEERCDELGLRRQGSGRAGRSAEAFMETIEARSGVSTGISAADRARTICVAADPRSTRHDLVKPGHVVPIRVSSDGAFARPGCAEAAIDLMRIAGLNPAAGVCHVLNAKGDVADYNEVVDLCHRARIPLVTTNDVLDYHLRTHRIVARSWTRVVRTAAGEFTAVSYRDRASSAVHYALVRGEVHGPEPALVRIHVQNAIDDVFAHEPAVLGALAEIARARAGVLLYMTRQLAIPPQWADGSETVVTETLGGGSLSGYAAVQILQELGVRSMRLAQPHQHAAGLP